MYGKKLDAVFRYTVCFFLLGIILSSVGFSVGIFEILYVGCTIVGLSTLVFIAVCILGSYNENRRYRRRLQQQRNNFDYEPVIIIVNPRVNPRIVRIPNQAKKFFCFSGFLIWCGLRALFRLFEGCALLTGCSEFSVQALQLLTDCHDLLTCIAVNGIAVAAVVVVTVVVTVTAGNGAQPVHVAVVPALCMRDLLADSRTAEVTQLLERRYELLLRVRTPVHVQNRARAVHDKGLVVPPVPEGFELEVLVRAYLVRLLVPGVDEARMELNWNAVNHSVRSRVHLAVALERKLLERKVGRSDE